MKRRDFIIRALLLGLMIAAAIVWLLIDGNAEEPETVWILCQPDSYVTNKGYIQSKYLD